MPRGSKEVRAVQEAEENELGGVEPESTEPDISENESATAELEKFIGDSAGDDVSRDQGEEAPDAEHEAATEAEAPEQERLEFKPKAKKTPELGEDIDPDLLPPERFTAKAKQAFINSPKGVRREINKAVREMEAHFTQANQQAQHHIREWAPLREAIAPFAQKWAEIGIGVVPGVLQLASVQAKLTDPNENIREAEYLKLAKRSKVDVVKLARKLLGQSGEGDTSLPDLQQHPQLQSLAEQNQALLNRLNSVESRIEESVVAQRAQPIASAMEAVRNEKDRASGRLLRPALQDEVFLESLKPLVSELVRTSPDLWELAEANAPKAYAEALKRAHDRRLRQMFGDSFQAGQIRLPASATNANRPLSNFSVRGRAAPVSSLSDPEIPDDIANSATESLRYFLTNSRGG